MYVSNHSNLLELENESLKKKNVKTKRYETIEVL